MKGVLLFILIFCSSFMFAAVPVQNLDDGGTDSITYYLDFSEMDATACGFSSNRVDDSIYPTNIESLQLSSVVEGTAGNNLSITGEGVAYAYIDIISISSFTVKIQQNGAMAGKNNPSSTIGWSCSIYDSLDIDGNNQLANIDDTNHTYTMYDSSTETGFEHQYCVLLRFKTENAVGKKIDEYQGQISLIIEGA